jgi:hypothetical protein
MGLYSKIVERQECQNYVDSMMKSHLHSFSRQVHVLRASIASAEGTSRTTHAITPVMVTNCNLLHFLMLLKISDACSTAIICWRRENPAVLSGITGGESSRYHINEQSCITSDGVALTPRRSVLQRLALTQHQLSLTVPRLLLDETLDLRPWRKLEPPLRKMRFVHCRDIIMSLNLQFKRESSVQNSNQLEQKYLQKMFQAFSR